jgi:hypothetical protein
VAKFEGVALQLIRRTVLPLLLAMGACADPSAPAGAPPIIAALPRQHTNVEAEMVTAANTFGFNLLQQVNTAFADTNVVM